MKNKTTVKNSKNSKRTTSRKNAPVTLSRTGRGRLGGLLGHSVAAVCRTLGKEGLKARQVQGLMDTLAVKVNPHTIHIQVGAGRNGNMSYGKPAELTKEQLGELLAKVPAVNAEN